MNIYLTNEKGLITERYQNLVRSKIEYDSNGNILKYYTVNSGNGIRGYDEYSTMINPYATSPELRFFETIIGVSASLEFWIHAFGPNFFYGQSTNWPLKTKRDNSFVYLNPQKVVETYAQLFPTKVVQQDETGKSVPKGFEINFDYIKN